ncbi:MAG TPA: hypothetical protein VFA26_22735 [Gemmataceae bacterium]|nr:hypothetical protein [Gemmataceae bacterium]
MSRLPENIRAVLATAGGLAAWPCLELALAAAQKAGARAIRSNQQRPPAEQFTLALRAADETLGRLAVELADDLGGGPPARRPKK